MRPAQAAQSSPRGRLIPISVETLWFGIARSTLEAMKRRLAAVRLRWRTTRGIGCPAPPCEPTGLHCWGGGGDVAARWGACRRRRLLPLLRTRSVGAGTTTPFPGVAVGQPGAGRLRAVRRLRGGCATGRSNSGTTPRWRPPRSPSDLGSRAKGSATSCARAVPVGPWLQR
jgi:hypothetical protein